MPRDRDHQELSDWHIENHCQTIQKIDAGVTQFTFQFADVCAINASVSG